MSSLIDQFCQQHFALNGIRPKRQRDQTNALREFEDHIGPKRIEEARASDLRSWMVFLIDGRKLHPNTVRWQANMVRPFFRWMYEQQEIDFDRIALLEVQDVRAPRGSRKQLDPKPYDRKEVMQFWEELAQHRPFAPDYLRRWRREQSRWNRVWRHAERLQMQAIIALALYGGLRQHEIGAVTLDDIDPLNEFIVVQHGKGDKPRKVPYTARAREWVEEWIEFRKELGPTHEHPWLTLGRYEVHRLNALPAKSLAEMFGKIGSGWKLHRFRHTCATEWLRAGMPLEQLKDILGHATIEQTLAYTRIVPTDALRSMARLESHFDRAVRPKEEVDA